MSTRYLFKRGNGYCFRIRVPSDLRPHFQVSEMWRSLHTDNGQLAKELAKPLALEAKHQFARLRASLRIDSLLRRDSLTAPMKPNETTNPAGAWKTIAPKCLSDAIAEFASEHEPQWQAKTLFMHRNTLARFKRVLGNSAVAELSRADCRRFRDSLLSPRDGGTLLKPATVNRHLAVVSSFFQWAIREGLRRDNPCQGLKIRRSVGSRAHEERDAFNSGELVSLFGDPLGAALLTACNAERAPSRYWVPLIALYSGMRLEEIAQLQTEDVRDISGVPCFDVNSKNGKRVKTAASIRLVPIHPYLLENGFLELVERRASVGKMILWTDLKSDGFGSRSSAFSKWFTRYRRAMGVRRPGVSFHSLRHTFINALKQSDVPEARIRQLVGHTESSITLGRYGKRYELEALARTVASLRFP